MKNVMIVICFIIFLMGGCSILDEIADPNTIAPIEQGLTAVGTIATGAGQPWGWILTTGAGLVGIIAASYNNWRNKVKAADKYEAIEITAKAIVDAVEATAALPAKEGTIGNLVKAQVQKELEDKGWFKTGKAIISALKQ